MNVIEIKDLNVKELDIYTKAGEREVENWLAPDEKLFIAESPYVIGLALDNGCRPLHVLAAKDKLNHPVLARCGEVPVYTAERGGLKELVGFEFANDMLCAMVRPEAKPWQSVTEGATRIAVLEHIMNPTNIGALFRSAAALGIEGILLTDDCADPLYRRAARVSMGTVLQIPWAYVSCDYVKELQQQGFCCVAMALREDAESLQDIRFQKEDKVALILGSEGNGLCEKTIAESDKCVRIPMQNGVDSLNVSVAGALGFWSIL